MWILYKNMSFLKNPYFATFYYQKGTSNGHNKGRLIHIVPKVIHRIVQIKFGTHKTF